MPKYAVGDIVATIDVKTNEIFDYSLIVKIEDDHYYLQSITHGDETWEDTCVIDEYMLTKLVS